MADLNDFGYTDDVDDILAVYVNNLLASTMRSEYKNVETLAADKTLTDADTPIQRLNCNGAARIVKVPTADAVENHPFFIVNSSAGAYAITVKSNDGVTILATVGQGAAVLVYPDGNGLYLTPNDHSQYLLADEQASDPTTPISNKWKLYFKSSGLFLMDDVGSVTGPLGGGLSISNISPTTANVTAAANTRYVANISGLTANRNFILPAGTAGQEIEILINVGDASYALILIGDTGITITGAGGTTAAATEWSRLFIDGEVVRFVATSATNWQVVRDDRIRQAGVMERQTAQSINNATDTKINLATSIMDTGNIVDAVTNYRITVRRGGLYEIMGFVSLAAGLDDQETISAEVFINGVISKYSSTYISAAAADRQAYAQINYKKVLSVGDYLELYIFHTEGAAVNTNTTNYPQLAVIEQI